jgi:hypothetical protein
MLFSSEKLSVAFKPNKATKAKKTVEHRETPAEQNTKTFRLRSFTNLCKSKHAWKAEKP